MIYHILLKPDVIVRKLIPKVFEIFEEQKIRVLLYSLIRPNECLLHQIYMDDFKWEYDYLSHNFNFYSLGPSLSLVCDVPSSIVCHIKSFKGSTLPIQLEFSSLRGKLNISDRCVNGIHMADNVERSWIEIHSIYQAHSFSEKIEAQTYKDIKINLLEHQFEEYSSLEADISLKTVLKHMLIRINQFLAFYDLVGNGQSSKVSVQPATLLKNCVRHIDEMPSLSEISSLIRFWDYFFSVLDMNMIYYHPFEKYIIQSENLYLEVDRNFTSLP